jgi:membrane-bound metal-dependent hydrolase YbcI (DUF457 family)
MPQNGFHGLVGLAAARWSVPHVPVAVAEPFAGGIVLGAMLPDIDMYPTAIAFLAGRHDLIYVIHRTLTHSLLAVLVVAGVGAALLRRSPAGAWAGFGLALGMLTHCVLDLFLWFAPIDLFWPFSRLPAGAPLLPVIDLWTGVRPLPGLFGRPYLLRNLLSALELAAFALYLLALRRLAARGPKGDGIASGIRRWERWTWAGFGVAVVGAFVLSNTLQEVLVHVPYLLALVPYCWRQAILLRAQIARWSLTSKGG